MPLPILSGHFPGPGWVLGQQGEAPQLLHLRNMQPELDDQRVIVRQCPLKLVDLFVSTNPVRNRCKLLHPLNHDPAIPTTVKDGHLAAPGELHPETPQPGHHQLVGLRGLGGNNFETARVQPPGQVADDGAFPGRVPPLKHDNGGQALLKGGNGQVIQALPLLVVDILKGSVRQSQGQIGLL